MKEENLSWYEEKIEEPVREIVKILRDNGFNTTCSCGHTMVITGEFLPDYDIKIMHDLLYNYLVEKGRKPDYEISFVVKVQEGFLVNSYWHIQFIERGKI
jgi:hypothetical protein